MRENDQVWKSVKGNGAGGFTLKALVNRTIPVELVKLAEVTDAVLLRSEFSSAWFSIFFLQAVEKKRTTTVAYNKRAWEIAFPE